jgi:hypothetical protein
MQITQSHRELADKGFKKNKSAVEFDRARAHALIDGSRSRPLTPACPERGKRAGNMLPALLALYG